MTDDFRLFADSGAARDGADDDSTYADTALVSAYLARELTLVQIVAVEERLATDNAFRAHAAPIIAAWTLPRSYGRVATKEPAGRAGPTTVAPSKSQFIGKASLLRVAAIVAAFSLPVAGLAQAVSYVASHPDLPGNAIARRIIAPFRKQAPQQSQIPVRTLTADLRITANDVPSTEIVTSVTSVSVASDGMIFSADQREARVRMFDVNGKFVRSFGSKGDGPGEFTGRFPSRFVGIRGDSVFTHENNSVGSVLLFRRNGMYLSTPLASRRGDRTIVAFLPGKRILARIGHRPPGSIAPADSDSFAITDSLGNLLTLLARDRGRHDRIAFGRGQPGVRIAGNFAQPFHFTADADDDPSGLRAVVASQWTLWGGAPGEVKLTFTTGSGSPTEHIVRFAPRRLTPTLVNTWLRERLDLAAPDLARAGTSRAAAEAEIRKQLQVPEYFPVFDDIRLGVDGAVWIKLFAGSSARRDPGTENSGPSVPGASLDWVVISPAGTIAYRVSVPTGLRVEQVSMDRMWAVQVDSDGLPVIVRFRVNQGRAVP